MVGASPNPIRQWNQFAPKMSVLGLFIILGCCVVGVPAPSTKMCYSCAGMHDPTSCTSIHKCHGDQVCGAEVILKHGDVLIDLGCYDRHNCDMAPASLVGKRGHDTYAKCCYANMCNGHMFSSPAPTQPVGALTTQAIVNHNIHECLSCDYVSEPSMCHHTEICQHDQRCGFDVVKEHNGNTHLWLGCMKRHDCDHNDPHHTRCRECCSGYQCNKNLCPAFHAAYTSAPTQGNVNTQAPITTSQSTTAAIISTTHASATTTAQPVTQTSTGVAVTTSTTSTPIVHTSPVQITTSGIPCVDHTGNGFQCSSFDQFDFCRDPTSFAYSIATTNCRKYCGFCSNTVVTTGSPKVHTTGTHTSSTAQPATAKPATKPTLAPSTTTQAPTTITAITGTQAPSIAATTFGGPCIDETANGFQCASFDMFNFCTDQASFAHPLALQKCPKHCGFCK